MRSSLLLQQCPACLVRLIWIVFVMDGRSPYSCCFVVCCLNDLFNIARSILMLLPSSFFSIRLVSVHVVQKNLPHLKLSAVCKWTLASVNRSSNSLIYKPFLHRTMSYDYSLNWFTPIVCRWIVFFTREYVTVTQGAFRPYLMLHRNNNLPGWIFNRLPGRFSIWNSIIPTLPEMRTKTLCGVTKDSPLLKSVSTVNAWCAPIETIIITDCIGKENDKISARLSNHYRLSKIPFTIKITV